MWFGVLAIGFNAFAAGLNTWQGEYGTALLHAILTAISILLCAPAPDETTRR